MFFDYHVHTSHSSDCPSSPRQMLDAAVEKGIKQICFTDHYDLDYVYDGGLTLVTDLPPYVEDVRRLQQEYQGKIDLCLGIEAGIHTSALDRLADCLAGYPWDYVIGSMHILNPPHPNYHVAESWEGKTSRDVIREYLPQLIENIQLYPDFDCVGHITYFSKFSPLTENREMFYRYAPDEFDELFRILAATGRGIEINTSTKDRYGYTLPEFECIKRYRELGGEIITIGSDAHFPEYLGNNFNYCLDMCRRAGFEYVATFKNRKPVFHKL